MQVVGELHVKQFDNEFATGSHWHRLELLTVNPVLHVKQVVESVHVRHSAIGVIHNSQEKVPVI